MHTFIKDSEVQNFGKGGPLAEVCPCSKFGAGLSESSDLKVCRSSQSFTER